MPSIHTPSADLFVVQPLSGVLDIASEQLVGVGQVEEVVTDPRLWVVRIAGETSDPREAWALIRARIEQASCREKVFAEPVLLDDRGAQHLPTGEVTVRFERAPSEDELRAFAETYKIHARGRAPYVPAQVVFLLDEPSSTYLPALISRLLTASGVKNAWANTLSSYRRALA